MRRNFAAFPFRSAVLEAAFFIFQGPKLFGSLRTAEGFEPVQRGPLHHQPIPCSYNMIKAISVQ